MLINFFCIEMSDSFKRIMINIKKKVIKANYQGSANQNHKITLQTFRMACVHTQSLRHVQVFATLWAVAHQAPQSMKLSRQEYGNWLPCPPPGNPLNLGIKPRSPTLQAYSLPFEPPGKPKNSGLGSLPLLQVILLTQELNWGLLHCRQILYQLSYQGGPLGWLLYLKKKNRITSVVRIWRKWNPSALLLRM